MSNRSKKIKKHCVDGHFLLDAMNGEFLPFHSKDFELLTNSLKRRNIVNLNNVVL